MEVEDQDRGSSLSKPMKIGLIVIASVVVICVLAVPQSNTVNDESKDVPAPVVTEVIPTLEEIRATGDNLTSEGEISVWRKRLATLPSEQVEAVEPGRGENPDNTKLVESIITKEEWDYLFPKRNSEYTYDNFLKAIAKFPAVCDPEKGEATCRNVLATLFAHFTQETGAHNPNDEEVPEEWRQGLKYLVEIGCEEKDCGYSTKNQYCKEPTYDENGRPDPWQAAAWPCGKKENGEYQSYHGRGAIQLSFNFNYGQFSASMFGDIRKLLDNPDLVKNTWLNFASAIWFYATPQPPKPSMLGTIVGDWEPSEEDKQRGIFPGFGVTTNILNGGIECNKGSETSSALNRAKYYKEFAKYLGVKIEGDTGCGRMKPFENKGDVNLYWDQDWSKKYHCKLVKWTTTYSALAYNDYVRCVRDIYKINI